MANKTGKWEVELRAKKSPYVRGLDKRTGQKIKVSNWKVNVGGSGLLTKKAVIDFMKECYPWAMIVKIKPVK